MLYVNLVERGLLEGRNGLGLICYMAVKMFRYDMTNNQVVICSNKCQDLNTVTTILTHELVHMYDNCTAAMDWNNIHHLACSEVR